MQILIAPAEFYFKPGNYHVTYNILKRVHAKFKVLCGFVHPDIKKILANSEIYEVGEPFFLYPFKIVTYGLKFVKKVQAIHHLSPFAIGKDFNLLALQTDKPFIIGPMEIPHKFFDDELEIFKIPKILQKLRDMKLRLALSLKTMERCDVAIAVNRQTKKYLLDFIDKQNIKIIPLGVDTKMFKFSPVPNNHEILAVGMHIRRKGFEYLIKAMSEIVKDYPDAKLHIVGQGPQTPYLIHLTEKLGLSKHVIFHGRVSDEELLKLYKRCRVFCHPSLSEGFCHTTLEAMAVGRPVVSTKTNGSEMIENGKTGVLVEPADVDALVNAIAKMLESYKLCTKMGRKAREITEKKYSWDMIAKSYYEIYKELTS